MIIALTVYATFFLTLGIVLSFVHVPKKFHFESYRTSIKLFGCAYILLGLSAVTISNIPKYFDATTRSYNLTYITVIISSMHAWLNAYAYLMMLHPLERNRHHFLCSARWLFPATMLIGALPATLPACRTVVLYLLGVLYIAQIIWMLWICYREYKECFSVLQDFYDGTMGFKWIRNILVLTIILAVFNLINFYFLYPAYLIIATILFYLYFAIRLFNYLPIYIYIEEARNTKVETEKLTDENGKSANTDEGQAALIRKQREKVEPLIAAWVKQEGFCRPSITLADVANDIGTNRNYLSSYLNKHLGVNFQTWLNNLRIERSKEYLSEYPEMTVDEIAHKVGFSQSYNFSRWFKQITSLAPMEWRKKSIQDYQNQQQP